MLLNLWRSQGIEELSLNGAELVEKSGNRIAELSSMLLNLWRSQGIEELS